MKTLIPMTDYLPEHPYSKFLKQRLEPYMFVACDEYGNFLEEPNKIYYLHSTFEYEKAVEQYQKAKERVLFEGFVLKEIDEDYLILTNGKFDVHFEKGDDKITVDHPKFDDYLYTIECFTIDTFFPKGESYNLQLTQTAINKINL